MKRIVSLNEYRQRRADEGKGAVSGPALCRDCRHEWAAAAPSGVIWLECPACGLQRGRFRGPFYPPETTQVFTCQCGGDVFVLTPRGVLCPYCGEWQRPYD